VRIVVGLAGPVVEAVATRDPLGLSGRQRALLEEIDSRGVASVRELRDPLQSTARADVLLDVQGGRPERCFRPRVAVIVR